MSISHLRVASAAAEKEKCAATNLVCVLLTTPFQSLDCYLVFFEVSAHHDIHKGMLHNRLLYIHLYSS